MASSMFDNASLYIVPSGGRAGFIYPIKPLGTANITAERDTAGTFVNEQGIVETAAIDVPRFDFSNPSFPALLAEGQATNGVLYSEDFTNAAWVKSGITVTANDTMAPDGMMTADRLTVSVAAADNYQDLVATSETPVYSIFVKKGNATEGANRFLIRNQTTATNLAAATINYDTWAITQTIGSGAYFEEKIYANGFRRLCIPIPSGISVGNTIRFRVGFTTAAQVVSDFAYFWGGMRETGSIATSYIPATASTVTRLADVIFLTSASSLIGQTFGGIRGGFIAGGNSGTVLMLSDGTTDDRIEIDYGVASAGVLRARVFDGGVEQASISTSALTAGEHAFFFKYGATDCKLYVDGTLIGSDATATIPACSRIDVGSSLTTSKWINGRLGNMVLYANEVADTVAQSYSTL